MNKRARHDYSVEQTFEAGLALEGWEVKSLRAGRTQLRDGYVIVPDTPGLGAVPDLDKISKYTVAGGADDARAA